VTVQQRIKTEADRLMPLVEMVLARYDLKIKSVDHLATHSNVLYRVVATDGRQMVLRVGSLEANSRSNIQYEVDWLAALNRETLIDVVAPIPTATGGMVTDAVDPATRENRHCVLFTWVPGVPLGDGAGTFSYRLLGRMSAQLQGHGRTWLPDDPAELRLWNRVFYYKPSLDPVTIFNARTDHLVEKPRRSVIQKALPLADRAVAFSWESATPQIVHGDLHEWNAHVVGTRLYAFDFEDVMVATPAQDVSVSLYSSRSSVMKDDIRAAFRAGFEEYGQWPVESEEQLDGLHAARQIMLMNYALRALPEGESVDYLDKVMPWIEGFVKKYG
jgi:Ser/Thr protein kinase RdoA (MazF antagonist)